MNQIQSIIVGSVVLFLVAFAAVRQNRFSLRVAWREFKVCLDVWRSSKP